jgi:urease accessory protein
VLSPLVEPAMDLLRQTWSDWRHSVWGLQGRAPRTWAL